MSNPLASAEARRAQILKDIELVDEYKNDCRECVTALSIADELRSKLAAPSVEQKGSEK